VIMGGPNKSGHDDEESEHGSSVRTLGVLGDLGGQIGWFRHAD